MNIPKDYSKLPINIEDLLTDPIAQFSRWLRQATDNGELEPTAFTLATVDINFDVTARVMLLKSFDEKGFVFFTNYSSFKSEQIKAVPKAAMVFWWPKCQRQVRIYGDVTKASTTQSDDYFKKRPQASQIAAIISKQSQQLLNRETLMREYDTLAKNLTDITRPDFWGGFILKPRGIEFWQGRPHRLHDRFQYQQKNDLWEIVQLYP